MSCSFIHPITKQYIEKLKAAGFNLNNARITEIDEFVSQLSRVIAPELWICWLMRADYNAGSGSTIFSLGGLENYPATAINNPTWGSNGIVMNTTQYINTNCPVTMPGTLGGVFARTGAFVASSIFLGNANAVTWRFRESVENTIQAGVFGVSGAAGPSIATNLTGFDNRFVTINRFGGTVELFIQNTSAGVGNIGTIDNLGTIQINARSNIASSNATYALVFMSPEILNQSQIINMNNIIKNTICKELGIP